MHSKRIAAAALIGCLGLCLPAHADYQVYDLYKLGTPSGASSPPDSNRINTIEKIAAGGGVASDVAYTYPAPYDNDSTQHAAVWSPTNSTGTDLHPDPNPNPDTVSVIYSLATATDGVQQVGFAGYYADNHADNHAALWTGSAGSYIDLNPASYTDSTADAVSHGEQVGVANRSDGTQHAFLWKGSAASGIDLGLGDPIGTDGVQQVGVDASFQHATVWSGSAASAVDLNPSGFGSSMAIDVSHGQQVGAVYGSNGYSFAALWTGTADSFVSMNPKNYTQSQIVATNGFQQVGTGLDQSGVNRNMVWSGTADSAQVLPNTFGNYNAIATSIDSAGNIYGVAIDAGGFMHAIEWKQNNAPQIGVVVDRSETTMMFSDALRFADIAPSAGGNATPTTVGTATNIQGTVLATDAQGNVRTLHNGDALYFGDTINASTGGAAQIAVGDSGGTDAPSPYSIVGGQSLKLDEYVYDPKPSDNYSTLRKVFEYLGNSSPPPEGGYARGSIGIRGDASDYTDIDKATMHKAAAINMGSPVKLYTAVSTPDGDFDLKFDYAFFDVSQTLSITIDGKIVFSSSAAIAGIGELFDVDQLITDSSLFDLTTTELAFHFDGDHGSLALVTDVSMPGLGNGDFSAADANWYSSSTDGSVEWSGIVTAVPEPSSLALSAMSAACLLKRRRRSCLNAL
jgi:hypothetical protein